MQRDKIFSYRNQVLTFAILVALVLAGAFFQSLDHAGIINLPSGNQETPETTESRATIDFEVVNASETEYIQVEIMDLNVQFTCDAENISSVRWDYGDLTGSDEGIIAFHNYSLPGEYLIEASIIFKNGDRVVEYYYLTIGEEIIFELNAPVIGQIWTFYTYTLLLAGILSLSWFAITFYHRKRKKGEIWPRAFRPPLRVILGMGLIFCYFVAIGFFNSIIMGLGGLL